MLRRRGLPATRVGGAAFCFLLTASSLSLFILCLGERDKKDDASAKFDTSKFAASHLLADP